MILKWLNVMFCGFNNIPKTHSGPTDQIQIIATQVEQNTYKLVKVDQDNQCSGLEVIIN